MIYAPRVRRRSSRPIEAHKLERRAEYDELRVE